MKAYIVNLPASVDTHLSAVRRTHISQQIDSAGLDGHFVKSVDGTRLSATDRRRLKVDESTLLRKPWLTPGVIGASLSHVQAYRDILDDGTAVGLVLEDDATLIPETQALLASIADRMNESEVVLCHWRAHRTCELSTHGVSAIHDYRLMYPMDLYSLSGAGGYLITRQACAQMLNAVLPIRAGTDAWAYFHEWGGFRTLRCCVPRLIGMQTNFKSTVGYLNSSSTVGQLSSYVARRRLFPFHQALSVRRRWAERRTDRWVSVNQVSPLMASSEHTSK